VDINQFLATQQLRKNFQVLVSQKTPKFKEHVFSLPYNIFNKCQIKKEPPPSKLLEEIRNKK